MTSRTDDLLSLWNSLYLYFFLNLPFYATITTVLRKSGPFQSKVKIQKASSVLSVFNF